MAKTSKRKSAKKKTTKKRSGGAKKQTSQARKSAGGSGKKSAATQTQQQPKSPMPPQHQEKPGIESKVRPRPEYEAPLYKGSGKLEDKVALITGGDSGIGRAVAVLYAREGANVAIVYLAEEQSDAEETRRAVEAEGRRALLIPGDVTVREFCEQAVEDTVNELGKLDILVNNAAFQKNQESIGEITDDQLEHTFRTN